jgi:putative salt-induced outer membrane protein YdiY
VTLVALAACPVWADQITLKNGDRVTGSIVKKEGKNLTIKSDLMGTVTVPWADVTDIQAGETLNVVLSGQKEEPPAVTKATISSANGQVTLSGGQAGPVTVAPERIETIRNAVEEQSYERMLRPGLLELWTGTLSVGLAGTAGNARTSTFTTGLTALRATNTDKASFYFNTVRSSATVNDVNSATANAVRGGWKYARHTGSRLEVSGFNDWEHDRFQNLDLRFVIGGGLGYRSWKSSRGELALQAGVDYDRDKFSASTDTPAFARISSEVYFGNDFNFKLNGATKIVQSSRIFNSLADRGEYRANFDLSADTKLRKWLDWNLTFSDHYLSNPIDTRRANDILYTTGIGVTFGK